MTKARWRIRLGDEAEKDFIRILQSTNDAFGPRQGVIYRATLVEALHYPENGPDVLGSVARDEIQEGPRSPRVARGSRRGRHFILFRAAEGGMIDVVRILYDAMDLKRQIHPNPD